MAKAKSRKIISPIIQKTLRKTYKNKTFERSFNKRNNTIIKHFKTFSQEIFPIIKRLRKFTTEQVTETKFLLFKHNNKTT